MIEDGKEVVGRFWRGVTASEDADRYLEYLKETGVRECTATEGNLGALVLRRVEGEKAEFLFLSFWEDMEAIERFAGPNPARAVYFPMDSDFLDEMSPGVEHYQAFSHR